MTTATEKYRAPQSTFEFSLAKMLPPGVTITDITGYTTKDFGEPVFKLCTVVLSNGARIWMEGEHDLPYLSTYEPIDGIIKELHEEESKADK